MNMVTTKINNFSYNHKNGIVLTNKLSEDLDIGFFTIPHLPSLNVDIGDPVEITDNGVTKKMMVSGVESEGVRMDGQMINNYLISIVSYAILLQRIILPNRTITHPLGGTKKTIISVLTRFLAIYAPNMSMSTELITKLGDEIAPEKTWNKPTLFEVFNDLLIKVNACVTMTDDTTITYLDLDPNPTPIDETKIIKEKTSKSISEYASALEMDLTNVKGLQHNASTGGWIGLRASDDTVLTTENAVLHLNNPILNINKLVVIKKPLPSGTIRYYCDITTQVLEKRVWNLKKTSNQSGNIYDPDGRDYRRNFIWFEEGDDKIQGFGFKESSRIPYTSNDTALQYAVNRAIVLPVNSGEHAGIFDTATDFAESLFYVEYTTIDDVTYRAYKSKDVNFESVLIDGQDDEWVDPIAFGLKQQSKINRIGNKETIIYGKYDSLADVPSLGQSYKGVNILTQMNVRIYETHCSMEAIATQDYTGKNRYGGVDSKKRYNSKAATNEAVVSNHITTKVLKLSFVNESSDLDLESYLILIGKAGIKITTAICRFKHSLIWHLRYMFKGSSFLFGDSVVFKFKMYDNISAGQQLLQASTWFGTGTINYMNEAMYTDDYGEYTEISIRLYKNLPLWGEYSGNNINVEDAVSEEEFLPSLAKAFAYPQVNYEDLDSSEEVFYETFKRYKDNRELPAESIQFRILSGDDDIIIGQKFYEYNPLVYNEDSDKTFTFYYSTSNTLTKYDKFLPSTGFSIDPLTDYVFYTNSISALSDDLSQLNWNNVTSWCLVDDNNEIVLGVNRNTKTVYLNKEV